MATAFNPCYCSEQDWATRLARTDAVLARCSRDAATRDFYALSFAENLHKAMGHRADQPLI